MNPPELAQKLTTLWPPANWLDVNVGIAVSGGADSVALLLSLVQIKKELGGDGNLAVFHVNHHLRGADSDLEQAWVEELCNKLGIPFEALQGDVAGRAETEGDGIEAAARQERYALLTQAAERHGARFLALAHTQNDQVETILFRLLRGTGLRGIGGINRSRVLTPTLTLIRPLLTCTREEILAYLSDREQSYCTDLSNEDCRFTRNRLRNELLPKLRCDYGLNIDQALLRLSEQASEVQSYIEAEARKLLTTSLDGLKTNAQAGSNSMKLKSSALVNHPPLLVREALRIAWREAGLAEQEMNFQWWCKLASLVQGDSSAAVLSLPGNVRAQSANDLLLLEW
ncbi:tRNA lysidine(34) synthetase TilS [Bythopirellula goksoeyrii]|uniref:tRNA(Ile)-lysidine synthase n=1 Tax=Bythopirellula goksoeyrii TaxID=1400387 RepID=A0A5B9QBY4_9BACT|nr:tRNA lysidine(34) synthetase TilS [Bythopirellula goksoeyrii]QEG35032.1 tRNA(Ile)-lysidine synthase [Bythopirellula goksoeyrii]